MSIRQKIRGGFGMPIMGRDSEDMSKMLGENWRLDNGHYIVQIEDVNLDTVTDGRRPVRWELKVKDTKRKLKKLHWIDTEGGVNLLISDLSRLGINATRENAITYCNSLIGVTIEIEVMHDGEYENINFLRRIH